MLLKARQFDVKVAETDPDSDSNPSDDSSVGTLEFGPSDDTHDELVSAIRNLMTMNHAIAGCFPAASLFFG